MDNNMEMFDQSSARIAVLENEVKNIASDVKEIRKDQKEQFELLINKIGAMDDRLNVLERWRWMIVGAAVVVGYILAHVKIDRLF